MGVNAGMQDVATTPDNNFQPWKDWQFPSKMSLEEQLCAFVWECFREDTAMADIMEREDYWKISESLGSIAEAIRIESSDNILARKLKATALMTCFFVIGPPNRLDWLQKSWMNLEESQRKDFLNHLENWKGVIPYAQVPRHGYAPPGGSVGNSEYIIIDKFNESSDDRQARHPIDQSGDQNLCRAIRKGIFSEPICVNLAFSSKMEIKHQFKKWLDKQYLESRQRFEVATWLRALAFIRYKANYPLKGVSHFQAEYAGIGKKRSVQKVLKSKPYMLPFFTGLNILFDQGKAEVKCLYSFQKAFPNEEPPEILD